MKLVYAFLLLPLLGGCPFNKCGDNNTDESEACDDGNNINADGCESDCSLPTCNNGVKDPGEICFTAIAPLGTDTAPTEPAAADFNGDGHQDIITANDIGESVSIVLGDGAGNVTRQTDVEPNSPVLFVTTGGFDGDLITDFAASLSDIDLIQVFAGQGDGTFGLIDTLSATNPGQLTTADFNGDGDQDILASSDDGVVLFLNDGTGAGTFEAPRISFVGSNPNIAAADFDGDGNLDVVAGVAGNLILLLGDGIGNLAPQAPQSIGAIRGRMVAADLNGDQLPDLAIANPSIDGDVSTFTNQAGVFTQAQTFPVASPLSLATTDINNDGALDIVVASNRDATLNSHIVLITSDSGTFTAQDPILIGEKELGGISTVDLNEDQLQDIVLTDTDNNQLIIFLSAP